MISEDATEAVEAMNPVQEVPAAHEAPVPVVDPSAFLPSSRIVNVSAVE